MGEETIALNRKARHEFHIEDTLEAGIVLTGTEIKSIRAGKVSLQEAYARIERGEAWLVGAHIAPYATRQPLEPRGEADPQAAPPQGRDPRAPGPDEVEGPDARPAAPLHRRPRPCEARSSASRAASSSTTAAATSPSATRGATSSASSRTPTAAGRVPRPAVRFRRRPRRRRGRTSRRSRRRAIEPYRCTWPSETPPRGSRGSAAGAGSSSEDRRGSRPASAARWPPSSASAWPRLPHLADSTRVVARRRRSDAGDRGRCAANQVVAAAGVDHRVGCRPVEPRATSAPVARLRLEPREPVLDPPGRIGRSAAASGR